MYVATARARVAVLARGRVARFVISWVAVSLVPFVFLTGHSRRGTFTCIAASRLRGGALRSPGQPLGTACLGDRVLDRGRGQPGWQPPGEHTRLANARASHDRGHRGRSGERATGPLTVLPGGLPDNYEDVSGIVLWTRESVTPIVCRRGIRCHRAAPGNAFVWRGGASS